MGKCSVLSVVYVYLHNLCFFLVQTDTNMNKYEFKLNFNLLLTFRYLIFTVWVFVLKLCVLYTN